MHQRHGMYLLTHSTLRHRMFVVRKSVIRGGKFDNSWSIIWVLRERLVNAKVKSHNFQLRLTYLILIIIWGTTFNYLLILFYYFLGITPSRSHKFKNPMQIHPSPLPNFLSLALSPFKLPISHPLNPRKGWEMRRSPKLEVCGPPVSSNSLIWSRWVRSCMDQYLCFWENDLWGTFFRPPPVTF
jgi:hypothetical protein